MDGEETQKSEIATVRCADHALVAALPAGVRVGAAAAGGAHGDLFIQSCDGATRR
jgi:hypothetical protein